jgi:replicative DNA helicase
MRTFYSIATERIDSLLAGRRGDRSMMQIMKDYFIEIDNRIKLAKKGEQTGIVTGLVHLNKYTNGWKPGELIIVAGRPGMGKTAVALNLFEKSAAKKEKMYCFSRSK